MKDIIGVILIIFLAVLITISTTQESAGNEDVSENINVLCLQSYHYGYLSAIKDQNSSIDYKLNMERDIKIFSKIMGIDSNKVNNYIKNRF